MLPLAQHRSHAKLGCGTPARQRMQVSNWTAVRASQFANSATGPAAGARRRERPHREPCSSAEGGAGASWLPANADRSCGDQGQPAARMTDGSIRHRAAVSAAVARLLPSDFRSRVRSRRQRRRRRRPRLPAGARLKQPGRIRDRSALPARPRRPGRAAERPGARSAGQRAGPDLRGPAACDPRQSALGERTG